MYIPKDAITAELPKSRLAIIGPPGSGKTTSLLTFPNLIIFDRDHKAPAGTTTIPAWNPDWADSLVKRTVKDVPNFRDAIKKWLRENHDKFEPEQTFALDSWTFIQDACDLQTHLEDDFMPANPKTGQKDGYWFWGQKLRYSKELCDFLKSMKCNVVVTFHETIDRDEQGRPNGKLRPMQDGSYKDALLGNFTEVFRMRSNLPRLNKAGLAQRDTSGQRVIDTGFFWQVAGDSVVDLNSNPTLGKILRRLNITQIEIKLDAEGNPTGGYQTIQELYAADCGVKAEKK